MAINHLRAAQTFLPRAIPLMTEMPGMKPSALLTPEQQERIQIAHADLYYHKYGNKAGKLFSRMCKGPHKPTYITSLKEWEGHVVTSHSEINTILQNFYTTLYTADIIDTVQAKH